MLDRSPLCISEPLAEKGEVPVEPCFWPKKSSGNDAQATHSTIEVCKEAPCVCGIVFIFSEQTWNLSSQFTRQLQNHEEQDRMKRIEKGMVAGVFSGIHRRRGRGYNAKQSDIFYVQSRFIVISHYVSPSPPTQKRAVATWRKGNAQTEKLVMCRNVNIILKLTCVQKIKMYSFRLTAPSSWWSCWHLQLNEKASRSKRIWRNAFCSMLFAHCNGESWLCRGNPQEKFECSWFISSCSNVTVYVYSSFLNAVTVTRHIYFLKHHTRTCCGG